MTAISNESGQRRTWRTRAMCRGMPTAKWFTDDSAAQKSALGVCHTCPVKHDCASEGMDQQYGIWGGLTADDRAAFRLNHTEDSA